MATASDIHQLQHHSSSVRVEFHKVDRLVSQAKAVDAHQVLGLTQTFGPHLHLPHLFECRPRIGHSIIPRSPTVSGVLTFRERERKEIKRLLEDMTRYEKNNEVIKVLYRGGFMENSGKYATAATKHWYDLHASVNKGNTRWGETTTIYLLVEGKVPLLCKLCWYWAFHWFLNQIWVQTGHAGACETCPPCTCRGHTWGLICQPCTDVLTHTYQCGKIKLLTAEALYKNDDYERKATVVEKA